MTTSKNIKELGDRIYVSGTFDLLHSGHIELFKYAKTLGTVIVSLNTDEFATAYKRKPTMPLTQRIVVIGTNKYVDEVVINTGDKDSKPAILKAQATHILHGDDWMGDSLMEQMGLTEEWLKEHDIKLIYKPYTQGISTTKLLNL